MRSRNNAHDSQMHRQLVDEVARQMFHGGIQDFAVAKRKAMERLRLPRSTPMPRNQEIEDALRAHQRLFGGNEDALLQQLREAALRAMEELSEFRPKLVGAVLKGVVDENTAVTLHLFAHSIEEVAWALMERRIDHRNSEHVLPMSSAVEERIPGFAFIAGEIAFELLVFSGRSRRRTPISRVDGRAIERASLSKVQSLVAAPGCASDSGP